VIHDLRHEPRYYGLSPLGSAELTKPGFVKNCTNFYVRRHYRVSPDVLVDRDVSMTVAAEIDQVREQFTQLYPVKGVRADCVRSGKVFETDVVVLDWVYRGFLDLYVEDGYSHVVLEEIINVR
jgi:hypothetical protein